MVIPRDDWQEKGRQPMSRQQQKLLCAACDDLASQLRWHGIVFSGPDFRHLLAAIVLGERLVPGYNDGMGPPGLIRMARSSLELTKSQATEAIQTAFDIGDNPKDQGLPDKPVKWCPVICLARWITEDQLYEVRQVYQAPNKDGSPENRCRERGSLHGVSGKG